MTYINSCSRYVFASLNGIFTLTDNLRIYTLANHTFLSTFMCVTRQKIIHFKHLSTLVARDSMFLSLDSLGATYCLPGVALRHKDHPFGITAFTRDTVHSSGGFRHFSPLHHASLSSPYACLYFKPNQLRLQGFYSCLRSDVQTSDS